MRKLIIIGNGFDRAHGLKTSYKQFIEYLINESINYNEKVRDELLDVGYLDSENKDYEFIKQNFSRLAHTQSTDKSRRIRFKNRLLCTIMMHSFQTDWVNIEEIYFRELCRASTSKNDINYVGKLNEEFEQIKMYLEAYLVSLLENKSIKLNPKFIDIFCEGTPDSLLIVNFNYTPIASFYLDKLQLIRERKVIHIHGELNSKENPIIFGYGDDTNPEYSQLVKQTNNLYLLNLKRPLYKNWDSYDQIKGFLDTGKYDIYTIGHSLGLSDKTLLNEIFEHSNVEKINLFHHKNRDSFQDLTANMLRLVSPNIINQKVINFRKSIVIPQINDV